MSGLVLSADFLSHGRVVASRGCCSASARLRPAAAAGGGTRQQASAAIASSVAPRPAARMAGVRCKRPAKGGRAEAP